jgi:hypothetical protein
MPVNFTATRIGATSPSSIPLRQVKFNGPLPSCCGAYAVFASVGLPSTGNFSVRYAAHLLRPGGRVDGDRWMVQNVHRPRGRASCGVAPARDSHIVERSWRAHA